jgi:hypothetical protein
MSTPYMMAFGVGHSTMAVLDTSIVFYCTVSTTTKLTLKLIRNHNNSNNSNNNSNPTRVNVGTNK